MDVGRDVRTAELYLLLDFGGRGLYDLTGASRETGVGLEYRYAQKYKLPMCSYFPVEKSRQNEYEAKKSKVQTEYQYYQLINDDADSFNQGVQSMGEWDSFVNSAVDMINNGYWDDFKFCDDRSKKLNLGSLILPGMPKPRRGMIARWS